MHAPATPSSSLKMAGARAAVRFEGLLQFQRSAQRWRGGDATAPPLVLLESRYEQMVENFATWLRPLLLPLPLPGKARDELHASLLADFRDEFTAPDGKHKHALFPGASALVGTIPPHTPTTHALRRDRSARYLGVWRARQAQTWPRWDRRPSRG